MAAAFPAGCDVSGACADGVTVGVMAAVCSWEVAMAGTPPGTIWVEFPVVMICWEAGLE